jgi:hypothetical protein
MNRPALQNGSDDRYWFQYADDMDVRTVGSVIEDMDKLLELCARSSASTL